MHKLEEWFYKYRKALKGQYGLYFSVFILLLFLVLFNDMADRSTSVGIIITLVRAGLIFSVIYALVCFISGKIH